MATHEEEMRMEAVKIGVLGCGRVSPMYLPNLVRSPLLDVVAVSDVVHELAAAAAEAYGVAKVLSPEELLADPGVEVILNLTPIRHHVEMTSAALDAGKHVYSEKPLATTVEEARRLVADAERRGLLLGCAPDTLLGSGFQASRDRFAEGAIGRPLGAQVFMFRRLPPT
ncbi:MAG: Gfo/Idh/MocA family oxidoreductase, partial [Candidatus Dormiibacterota bacterium]